MKLWWLPAAMAVLLTAPRPGAAQGRSEKGFAQRSGAQTALGQMNAAITALARRVNPSVVKVVATGYQPLSEEEEGGIALPQASGGSGVIVDSEGYIVTNAHVVFGAQKLRVMLSPQFDQSVKRESILKPAARTLPATVVGLDFETDLAVLKVEMSGLPALPFGDSDRLEPGQLVLAFGSPLGLQNSVTLGIVSSPARQLRPEDPMIYVQTDASINPGNSGGPLVNTDGEIVGINTLIFSQSGGNEGIGFAAPSNIAGNVVRHIREDGRMIRGEIGVLPQTIDAAMAAGLKLSRAYGVILGDVYPGGPADQAGLHPGDVVLSLDGKPMENARQFMVNLYRPHVGEMVRLEVLRGRDARTVPVEVVERPDDPGRFNSLVTTPANRIGPLGVLALDLTPQVKQLLPPLRKGLGILVANRTADAPRSEDGFRTGDIIYQVNDEPVTNVAELRGLLDRMPSGAPAVVQVERGGRLRFVTLELP